MKKIWKVIQELNWSVIGAGFVIITLTGSVKQTAILLTVFATLTAAVGILTTKEDEQ